MNDKNELVFLPLGGVGEIGMNLALYGYGPAAKREWIMVDCGVTFPGPDLPGVDLVLADVSFIAARKNKLKAMTVLRSRLYEIEQTKLATERGDARRSQIGTGERSEKIRTYNYPQDRITDHRIKLNASNIPAVMEGGIDVFLHELRAADEAERLRDAGLDESPTAAD